MRAGRQEGRKAGFLEKKCRLGKFKPAFLPSCPPVILTFDTALDKMYVVLEKDGKVLSSRVVETTKERYHSAYLISTIKSVLEENNLRAVDVNLIGVNIGPGSFTGIRACVTAARVMAQAVNRRAGRQEGRRAGFLREEDLAVIGVSSLEILARINPTDKPSLVALDARKNSAYLFAGNKLYEHAVPLEEVKKIIEAGDYFVITDDKLLPVLGGISYQQGDYPLGEILAEIAQEKLQSGTDGDWRSLLPLYIQPPAVHC